MIRLAVRGILLDVEGTTSSVSYVYDVMFPYARRELENYLRAHWDAEELAAARELIARDAGHPSFAAWCGPAADTEHGFTLVRDEIVRLMDGDEKATGLKQLQGFIWRAGFESGELQSHVYDDVPAALAAWNQAGRDVRIYSSGSIAAQKLFFGHTIQGNLLPRLQGHYDTTIGPKRESASYAAIAADFHLPPSEIFFLSDIIAELDAARQAGMKTALVLRPGNAAVPVGHGHETISDFSEIVLK